MKKTINLRAHHLLCTVLYKGHGYSKKFNENMSMVVEALRNGCMISLKNTPDAICTECPNRMENGGCMLDDEVSQKGIQDGSIVSLDDRILERFDFNCEETYDSSQLYSTIRNKITLQDYEKMCGTCRWRREGLCSYSEYMERIDNFIQE